MPALTSLLARDEVVPVQLIEDALQRQVLEGGDLDTALLELSAVPENTLNAYRAASYECAPASRADLMSVSDEALDLVGVELARRYRVVPLGRSGGRITLAAARPLDADARRVLVDALGAELVVRVAVEVRVEAALAIFYGVEISGRMRMLAEHLDAASAGELPVVAGVASEDSLELDASLLSGLDSEPPPVASSPDGDGDTKRGSVPAAEEDPLAVPGMMGAEGPGAKARPAPSPNVSIAPVVSIAPQPPSPVVTSSAESVKSARLAIEAKPTTADEAPPGGAIPGTASPSLTPWKTKRAPSRPRFRRVSAVPKGPLSAAKARAMLETVSDRDGIVDVFFSFARQYFDVTVLFAARADRLLGLEAHGVVDESDISGVSVSIPTGSAIEHVLRSLLPRVANLNRNEVDGGLGRALGREGSQPAALIPVCIRQRAVLVLYGDRDGEPFKLEDLGELLSVVPGVVRAFERVIRGQKMLAGRAGHVARAGRSPSTSPASQPPPVTEGGAARGRSPAEVQALSAMGLLRSAPPPPDISAVALRSEREDSGQAPDETVDDPTVHPTVRLPVQEQPELAEMEEEPRDPAPETGRRTSSAHPSERPPGVGAYRSVAPGPPESVGSIPSLRSPSPPSEERRTSPERPSARALAAVSGELEPAHKDEKAGDDREQTTRYSVRPGTQEVVSLPDSESNAPSVATGSPGQRDDGDSTPSPSSSDDGQPGGLATTATQSEGEANKNAEPSIIVDIGADVDAMIDELCASAPDDDGSALRPLLKLGSTVLPALSGRFPGPLWFDRHRPHKRLPAARDVSAITRAMAAFRAQAAPFLAELLGSDDADVRFYAALLAVEQAVPAIIGPLGQAVFDADAQVRLLVREALSGFRGVQGYGSMVASWRDCAGDRAASVQTRLDAVSALGSVRDPESVSLLIELNGHPDKQLAVPAHRALIAITAQDFGKSTRKWKNWCKKAAKQPRILWLIDSLAQSDEQLRAVAGNELQKASQKYFGYVASAPKKDRERAQNRYRQWWEAEGKHK